jgi:hypothetical protein
MALEAISNDLKIFEWMKEIIQSLPLSFILKLLK